MLVQQSLGAVYQSPTIVSIAGLTCADPLRSPRFQLSPRSARSIPVQIQPSVTHAGNSIGSLSTSAPYLAPANINASEPRTSLRPQSPSSSAHSGIVAQSGGIALTSRAGPEQNKKPSAGPPTTTDIGTSATPSTTAFYLNYNMATSGSPAETQPGDTGAGAPGSSMPSSSKTHARTPPFDSGSGLQVQPRPKKQRVGRERVRIELAPDQPPTTQGKQRERVFVACVQCRSRKIRCDGARPMCFNCRHRVTGKCEYDPVPKRRGPDRTPGSRQRPGKTGGVGTSSSSNDAAEGSIAHGGGEDVALTPNNEGDRSGQVSVLTGDDSKASKSKRRPAAGSSTTPSASNESRSRSRTHIASAADVATGTISSRANSKLAPAPTASSSDHSREATKGVQETFRAQEQVSYYDSPAVIPSAPLAGLFEDVQQPRPIGGHAGDVQHVRYDHFDNFQTYDRRLHPYPYSVGPNDGSNHRPFLPHEQSDIGAESLHRLASCASEQELHPSVTQDLRQNLPGYTGVPHVAQTAHSPAYQTMYFAHTPSRGTDMYQQSTSFNVGTFVGPSVPAPLQSSLPDNVIDPSLVSSASPDSYFSGDTPEQNQPDYAIVDGHIMHASSDSYQLPYESRHIRADPSSAAQTEAMGRSLFGGTVDAGIQNATSFAPTSYDSFSHQNELAMGGMASGAYITTIEEERERQQHALAQDGRSYATSITPPPSLEFIRKTWWDTLLATYALGPFGAPELLYYGNPSPPIAPAHSSQSSSLSPTRKEISGIIFRDIQYLFKHSNYWFAFMNVPTFFSTFCAPHTRDEMQPALVLAILALSQILRSSEAQLGARGREKALWLRDRAQAALEASVNAQWIEPGLAQAAWLLCVFEISAHPLRSNGRCSSSFATLDSIIRTLSLTRIDAGNPSATSFRPRTVPRVLPPHGSTSQPPPSPLHTRHLPPHHTSPTTLDQTHARHSADLSVALPSSSRGCSCAALSHGQVWPQAQEHTPLWLFTPAWNPDWTPVEIQKEECRRLVWSALSLIAGYTTYRSAMDMSAPNLFVMQSNHYSLLFPGENLASLSASNGSGQRQHSKETVWALYARSMLLWHSCLRMREEDASDHERAQFANAVWFEAKAIEDTLNTHTCGTERAFLFQGREYLFNARMYISYEYTRYVPHPSTAMSGVVHKQMAEEWLRHQANVASRVMQGLHTVTGQKNNVLAQRPFFVYWFMSQIARCLQVWRLDKSQTVAVELSKQFLPPIDYLTALWPCEDQRRLYRKIRQDLEEACHSARLPPPPNPTIVSPPSPEALV